MRIFAHRGASGDYPENTLSAFRAAIASGCYGIELDVYALDGELIVIHDRPLKRTTNGQGNIEDYALADLLALDAGRGEAIPLLWQVLELLPAAMMLNIELKGHDTAGLLIELLRKAQQELNLNINHILVSSFHHPLLQQIHQLWPALKIGALTACIPLHLAQFATDLNAYSLHCDRAFVDQQLVEDAKQRGLQVYVYTVNDQREALRLQQLGVDGIFCNFPAQAQQWFETSDVISD